MNTNKNNKIHLIPDYAIAYELHELKRIIKSIWW